MQLLLMKLIKIVLNRKQWFAIVDCQLGDDTDRGKDITVICDVMAKSMHQNIPLFEPLVACLLPISYQLHHVLPLLGACNTHGTLNPQRRLSNVTIISFNTFARIKKCHKRAAEDLDIIPESWLVRPTNPTNISRFDWDCNFITETRLLKFVGVPIPASLRDTYVSSINREQTVLPIITLIPVLKFDLKID